VSINRLTLADGMQYLFAALWMSDTWYFTYIDNIRSRNRHKRGLAVYSRARAVVLFDRVLNGEMRG
jgi:hypothetical protein